MSSNGVMKALKLQGSSLVMKEDTPVPQISKPDDVLIKVSVAGVCGTDLHILSGDFDAVQNVTLGHEIVGVVEAVGADVTHYKKGDRVVVNPHGNCNDCFYCERACPHFCVNKSKFPSVGMKRDGSFANYCIAPESYCHSLADSISNEEGILLEPFSCIMHAVNRAEPLDANTEVLVLGAGIIGLLATIYLANRGMKSVTVVELIDHRRETVESLKLPGVRAVTPSVIQQEREAHKDDATFGYDRSFDFTGAPPAIQLGFDALRKRGKLVLFGVMKKDAKVNFAPHDILYKEVTITGALTNPGTMGPALAAIEVLSKANLLSMKVLDIKTYTLDDYQSAMDALKKGSIGKAMLLPA